MYNGDDRVKQVEEIRRQVDILEHAAYVHQSDMDVDELIQWWENQTAKPEWWDDHDTGLLKKFLQESAN